MGKEKLEVTFVQRCSGETRVLDWTRSGKGNKAKNNSPESGPEAVASGTASVSVSKEGALLFTNVGGEFVSRSWSWSREWVAPCDEEWNASRESRGSELRECEDQRGRKTFAALKAADRCYVDAADYRHSPSYCEHVRRDRSRDSCYQVVGTGRLQPKACEKIEDDTDYERCVRKLADSRKDSSLCLMLPRDWDVSRCKQEIDKTP